MCDLATFYAPGLGFAHGVRDSGPPIDRRIAQHQLGQGIDLEPPHQAGAAHLDGAHRDAERARYLLVLVALGDELQQLVLAGGEPLEGVSMGKARRRGQGCLVGPRFGGEEGGQPADEKKLTTAHKN